MGETQHAKTQTPELDGLAPYSDLEPGRKVRPHRDAGEPVARLRVSDGDDMQMSGYPTKVKSMSWLPKGRYLATGGAESVVCWPFHGKGGPVGKAAIDLGWASMVW